MALSIVLLLLLVVVLPAFIIRTVWRQQPRDRFSWMMTTVTSGAFLLYTLVIGRWDWISYYLPIGRVANSGNTTEPHLHVHAVRAGSGGVEDGIGMPIEFDGTFPVRNTTY